MFYTSYSHRQTKLFEGGCSENLNKNLLRKDQNLDVVDVEKNSIYEHSFIIKEVEQDQLLTNIEEPKDQQFEEDLLSKMIYWKKFLKMLKKEIWN